MQSRIQPQPISTTRSKTFQAKASNTKFQTPPPAKVSRIIQRRHEGLPKPIIDRAWDAQLRLCGRFRRLTARGKLRNVAVVGVARELAAFIWDIARMTPVAPAA